MPRNPDPIQAILPVRSTPKMDPLLWTLIPLFLTFIGLAIFTGYVLWIFLKDDF